MRVIEEIAQLAHLVQGNRGYKRVNDVDEFLARQVASLVSIHDDHQLPDSELLLLQGLADLAKDFEHKLLVWYTLARFKDASGCG